MNELFDSKALVYYPTNQDEFQFVQKDELQVMQEMDKEDPMNNEENH